jgi:hypothetical protein
METFANGIKLGMTHNGLGEQKELPRADHCRVDFMLSNIDI